MTGHDVFISAERPVGEVRAAVEAALGTAFPISEDTEPVPALAVGAAKVFFHHSHASEDDRDFTVSRYRYWISVVDSARDEQRQLAVAQRVFDAVKALSWPAMLSFDLQGSIAIYP